MGMRLEVRSLSADQRKAFTDALLTLKKRGRYDAYVRWHHAVRSGADRGPLFLPWHREFLAQVEGDLQKINAAITIPFWDWTIDSQLADPRTSPVWSPDLMGGNGVEADGWKVGDGPFAFAAGNWPIPDSHGGPALVRRFGFARAKLPTPEDVARKIADAFDGAALDNGSPSIRVSSDRLEGRVTHLHDQVHVSIGGDMSQMRSPNDPIFWMHHAFIDKLWMDLQMRYGFEWEYRGPQHDVAGARLSGRNISGVPSPWTQVIEDVRDIAKLGYSYEAVGNAGQILDIAKSLSSQRPST